MKVLVPHYFHYLMMCWYLETVNLITTITSNNIPKLSFKLQVSFKTYFDIHKSIQFISYQ